MNLIDFIGCQVKIQLLNNYYYVGMVTNADEDSLDLTDIKGKKVSLNKESILLIQEVTK